jgi:hypothetical protein
MENEEHEMNEQGISDWRTHTRITKKISYTYETENIITYIHTRVDMMAIWGNI